MGGVRDYLEWHELYDDPGSSLSRRLALVRDVLHAGLEIRSGPVRVLSLCAGDGRDILGVLAARDDAARVSATLVEVLPSLVERARRAAADVGADVEVVAADAGCSETYAGLTTVPRPFDVGDDQTTLGVARYSGPPVPLGAMETWFTFRG